MYRGTSWAAGLHTNPPGCRATFLVFRTRGGRSLRHASQRDDAPDGAIRTAIFSNGMLAMGGSNATTPGGNTLASSTPRLGNN